MTTKSKIIPFSILTIGFILGASALSTLAQFTPAPSSPPTCPVEIPGCNPPINTSSTTQSKNGVLRLKAGIEGSNSSGAFGLEVLNGIKLIDGTVGVGAGPNNMVLTADANGVGNWKALPASGGGGFDAVTPVVSVEKTNGTKTIAIASSTAQWPLCFVTKTKFNGSSNNNFNTRCSIAGSSGDWILSAYASGDEEASCSARCMGYAIDPIAVTCTTPKSTVLLYQQMTWTAIPATPGSYQYKFSDQATPSSSNTYTVIPQSPMPAGYSQTVTVYDNTGSVMIGTYVCKNLEKNTNTVVIPQIRPAIRINNGTSSDVCPKIRLSISDPARRVLWSEYFGSYGNNPKWLNASDQEIGSGVAFTLTTSGTYYIKHKRQTGQYVNGTGQLVPSYVDGTISCEITVDP